jgi:hypothetical protein
MKTVAGWGSVIADCSAGRLSTSKRPAPKVPGAELQRISVDETSAVRGASRCLQCACFSTMVKAVEDETLRGMNWRRISHRSQGSSGQAAHGAARKRETSGNDRNA